MSWASSVQPESTDHQLRLPGMTPRRACRDGAAHAMPVLPVTQLEGLSDNDLECFYCSESRSRRARAHVQVFGKKG